MDRMRLWPLRLGKVAGVALATVVALRVYDARDKPKPRLWHREAPRSEMKAAELDRMTLAGYLRRESQVFRETRALEARLPKGDRTPANRYSPESALNPGRFARDWNRTFELEPEGAVRGGALLVHGLTDSPYSVRPLAELLRSRGYYALGLRMPGHGTVPAALQRAEWKDWRAAFRLGARHVRGRIGPGKPLVLVGYSNGGALAVQYALDGLEEPRLPRPDRVVLLSPMLGVDRLARFSRILDALGGLGLEKLRWTGIVPEYNPFKYNSFPVHAGRQTHELTEAIDAALREAAKTGRLARLPPLLAFQPLADDSVSTPAVTARLFDRLTSGGHELVLFDLNREAYLRPLLSPAMEGWLAALRSGPPRPYTLSLVTNRSAETAEVEVRRREAETGAETRRPLGLAWPKEVYSLSHVAIPFPPDDPLYGVDPPPVELYPVRLGALTPRGERGVLILPIQNLMRMSCNPFYPYLAERVVQALPSQD